MPQQKTILIGRLNDNPELKQGESVCYSEFGISNTIVNEDKKVIVQKHECKAFGKRATTIVKNLCKDDLCCIEGRIDNHNNKQTIIVEKVTFLTKPKHYTELDNIYP